VRLRDRLENLLQAPLRDGELALIGATAALEVGFEVRDVQALREHYGRTLRAWVTKPLAFEQGGPAGAAGRDQHHGADPRRPGSPSKVVVEHSSP
jgi:hypothetical protein